MVDDLLTAAPEAGPEIESPRRRVPLWGKFGVGVSIFLVVVVLAGFVIHVPYSTIAPGDAVSLSDLVHVKGARTYTSNSDIRLLFVRERNHINVWQYLQARLDPDIDLFKEKVLNPYQLSQSQLNAQAAQDMADAKTAATVVALEAAGYKVRTAPGLTVSDLLTGDPAEKVLKYGDVILRADGQRITTAADLTRAINKHQPGGHVTLDILRDGKPMTVQVGIGEDLGRRIIGVIASPRFDFPVNISVDTAGIGGPSAGLAMSLAILDDLTPGSLTGGKRVAVTGTIDPLGNVGEIGGIEQKAVAARAAHAQMFIVPQCSRSDSPAQLAGCQKDLQRAIARAGSGVKVVPVSTFEQALAALQAAGGAAVPPTTSVRAA